MTNPAKSYFNIPLADIYNQAIDSLISDCGLSLPCKLIKTSGKCVECPNCIYNPITKKSLNKYKPGGPIVFDTGLTCPFCLGRGQSQEKNEQILNLFVCFERKKFIPVFAGAANPVISDGDAQTVCRIEYYLDIISCDFIYFNSCDGCIESDKYQRSAKPQFAGIGRPKFIVTSWSLVS